MLLMLLASSSSLTVVTRQPQWAAARPITSATRAALDGSGLVSRHPVTTVTMAQKWSASNKLRSDLADRAED